MSAPLLLLLSHLSPDRTGRNTGFIWTLNIFAQLFLGGLTRGSIYALIALGYTMVYGIIELINFAHGEIYMIGAFTGLIIASVLTLMGFPTLAVVILAGMAAIIYSCAYGFTMEKIAYKPLRNAPRLSALISAIGMSLFLQNYVLLAQTSDFLPFPSLIPDFDFWEPYAHILTSPELVIINHHSSGYDPFNYPDQIHQDRQGHASHLPGQNDGGPAWHQRG